MTSSPSKKDALFQLLWDFWCTISLVGIWPRFIEPNLLGTTRHQIAIPDLPQDLKNFKILQFSDLHLCQHVSDRFLNKILKNTQSLNPDLIVFTGDFLCYGKMEEEKRLLDFLKKFQAPYGCYAIVGNHDYDQFISVDEQGNYDVLDTQTSTLTRSFKRLFHRPILTKQRTERAQNVQILPQLKDLLSQTPFTLLENSGRLIKVNNTFINLCGLGEYIAGQCLPKKAFQGYDPRFPGIILAHNPDSFSLLKNEPGDLILCGHTHGGQVNLPWLWKKFMLSENMHLKKGLFKMNGKTLYVNRGLGSVMNFRWFSPPELTLFTLEAAS